MLQQVVHDHGRLDLARGSHGCVLGPVGLADGEVKVKCRDVKCLQTEPAALLGQQGPADLQC